MEDLARIEARLESHRELSELVGALRSMAASRAREAQEALEGTKQYCAIVERAIREISPIAGYALPDMDEAGHGSAAVVAVTSENGFVGGFNTQLIDRALEVREPGQRLIIVGRRGEVAASERGIDIDDAIAMTSRRDGVTALSRRLARRLSGATAVQLIFARPTDSAGYQVEDRKVLPLDAPTAVSTSRLDAPLYHLPPDELIEGLAREYLLAEIADALMESLASENAARLRTMDAASRNIDERLEKLTREERAARQEQTTADMLEVVTGAEAVNHR